jgi:hypothetical protein
MIRDWGICCLVHSTGKRQIFVKSFERFHPEKSELPCMCLNVCAAVLLLLLLLLAAACV